MGKPKFLINEKIEGLHVIIYATSHASFNILQVTGSQVTQIIILVMILRLIGKYQHKNNFQILLLRWLAQASILHKGEDYILVQTNYHALTGRIYDKY